MDLAVPQGNPHILDHLHHQTADQLTPMGHLWLLQDNFFVYGWQAMKTDFGGHDNHHYEPWRHELAEGQEVTMLSVTIN